MIIINLYLLWGTWQDIKERKITVNYLRIGEIGSFVYGMLCFFFQYKTLEEWFWGILPGMIFLTLGKVSREKIGYGDGMVLLILGNMLHGGEIWILLQTALILLMIFSLLLLITKKAENRCEIPFLPFIWMSHTLLWGIYYV